MPPRPVPAPEFHRTVRDRPRELDDWRYLLGAVHATFRAGSFTAAAGLVAAIAEAADRAEHHPDVDLRYPDRVHVSVTTHEIGAVSERDEALAVEISRLAAGAGASPDPMSAMALEWAIDTMDLARIRPFWQAVLDYRPRGDNILVDPRGIGPQVWFQEMDEPRPQRNRIHIDVTVPHDLAEQRVAVAVAAGGRVVSDARARAFWVLADADGNEVCVCTWQDRD